MFHRQATSDVPMFLSQDRVTQEQVLQYQRVCNIYMRLWTRLVHFSASVSIHYAVTAG